MLYYSEFIGLLTTPLGLYHRQFAVEVYQHLLKVFNLLLEVVLLFDGLNHSFFVALVQRGHLLFGAVEVHTGIKVFFDAALWEREQKQQ